MEAKVQRLDNISGSLEEAEQDEVCGCCSESWLAHLSELVSVVSGSPMVAHNRGMYQSAWQKLLSSNRIPL